MFKYPQEGNKTKIHKENQEARNKAEDLSLTDKPLY